MWYIILFPINSHPTRNALPLRNKYSQFIIFKPPTKNKIEGTCCLYTPDVIDFNFLPFLQTLFAATKEEIM